MHRIIKLKSGIKVKLWSDNEDCTLHVFDADQVFDPYSTYLTVVNYSEVSPEDLKSLAFYKSNDAQVLPKIIPMPSLPKNNNPYQHERELMGCSVSGAWVAMYFEHSGLKHDYNLSFEEKKRKENGELIWYEDPEFIVMVNQRTGQRFKMEF